MRIAWAVLLAGVGLSSAAQAREDEFAAIDRKVEVLQPKAVEKLFDTIAWAPTITEALRLAKEHRRPVFLFTYSGYDMAGFRC